MAGFLPVWPSSSSYNGLPCFRTISLGRCRQNGAHLAPFLSCGLWTVASNIFQALSQALGGGAHAFQQLQYLYLDNTAISGTLPESWASVGAFPELIGLDISNTLLTGSAPVSWGFPTVLPNLAYMTLSYMVVCQVSTTVSSPQLY